MNKKESYNLILKYSIFLLGIFLSLFSLTGLVHISFNMGLLLNVGSVGLATEAVNDSCLVITNMDEGGGGKTSGLMIGDTLKSINNIEITKKTISGDFWGPPEVGYKVPVKIARDGEIKNITVIKTVTKLKEKLLNLAVVVTFPFLMFVYSLIGLWILLKNRLSIEIISITLVCYTIGALMYTVINTSIYEDAFLKAIHFRSIREEISNIVLFVPAFWILLFSRFPEKTKFYKKYKISFTILIFFLPVVTIAADYFPIFEGSLKIVRKVIVISALLYIFIGMFIGILILLRNSRRFNDALRNRQFKLLFFGIKYGGISLLTGWISLILFVYVKQVRMNFEFVMIIIFVLGSIGGLLIPFTFLNTLLKKKLLETEWAFKNKIRDVLITTGLFGMYLVIIFQIGDFIVVKFNLSDQSMIIIISIIISLTFYPINQILHKKLENKFHPERNLYKEKIKEFSSRLQNIAEINSLLLEFSGWLENNFKIKSAITYSLEGGSRSLPFTPKDEMSIIKKINNGTPFFWDELPDEQKDQINTVEKNWAAENQISVTFPMISHGELVGVLNIGKKTSHEDYNGEDIALLKECVSQAAVAMQNLKLQIEYIEKKRLDKELNLARGIQAQLMPRNIPTIKGLDLYGKMRPCFEVAGDYFDIIPLDENRAILAVADVSGKGAGAAMLMSNLQAALRSSLKFSSNMVSIVYEINNIVNGNTTPGQFITFFVGLWDFSNHSFEYINAGHNPPIIIRKNDSVIQLRPTGFFLGPIPNTEFKIEKVEFNKGDMISIYTDGIEETFNQEYEQFGLERIIETIKQNKKTSSLEICNSLYEKTEEFANGLPYMDDATVIVAKVIE